jgi:tRNA G37 N-methylase TrmD
VAIVLRQGLHKGIVSWRKKQLVRRTKVSRPTPKNMRRDTKDAERLEALTEQYISEGIDAEPARQRAFNAMRDE